jgi:putative ABC transport system substrate-binding protein
MSGKRRPDAVSRRKCTTGLGWLSWPPPASLPGFLATLWKWKALSQHSPRYLHHRLLIVELVEKNHLPAMYGAREFTEVGGLMAYQADQGEAGRRMADDVHQILNGAKLGDIPIYQATKFTFIINPKTAKALGVTIPAILLARADEVIE